MPNLSIIHASNTNLTPSTAPQTAIFLGATAGIGKITLTALIKLGFEFKAYVIGRKASFPAFRTFAAEMKGVNAKASLIWIEGEVSLLAEAKRVCEEIKKRETRVDLLFMSTGYAPLGGRRSELRSEMERNDFSSADQCRDTEEGLDISHALELYTRITFTQNVLPQLRASPAARVISVLAGGMETARFLDVGDLTLEKPGAWFVAGTQFHMGMMNTLTLEKLAEEPENAGIVFIHSHPGIVRTGNLFRGWSEGSWGPWLSAIFFDPILRLFAISCEESAGRYLYQVTSEAFGGKGPKGGGVVGKTTRGKESGGLFLVNRKCDAVANEKEMVKLRAKAGDVVWDTVQGIVRPYI
jgi:NAD(P)-dependent dehydrogenase (short-subunit alcohol dehydrogenase family)